MFKTMLQMKIEADIENTVVRYKDHVVVAEFLCGPCGGYFTAQIWEPIETEEEADVPFHELRLENVTPWEPLSIDAAWETDGEALMAAMQAVDSL